MASRYTEGRSIRLFTTVVFGLSLATPLLEPAPVALSADRGETASLAGVYKRQFENGDVSGAKYTSENILEIVPTSNRTAYFRVRLEFFNGHLCAMFGMAHTEGDDLVYRHANLYSASGRPKECVFKIRRDGAVVRLDDDGNSCKDNCGMRGSFMNATFPAASRRTIRYLDRLKSSWQYKDAVAEDAKVEPSPTSPP